MRRLWVVALLAVAAVAVTAVVATRDDGGPSVGGAADEVVRGVCRVSSSACARTTA